MKHRVMIAFASILAFSSAFGQFGPPDPKMIEKYKPWFELQNMVNIMLEMDKQPGLAFNSNQAKKPHRSSKTLATVRNSNSKMRGRSHSNSRKRWSQPSN